MIFTLGWIRATAVRASVANSVALPVESVPLGARSRYQGQWMVRKKKLTHSSLLNLRSRIWQLGKELKVKHLRTTVGFMCGGYQPHD